MEIQEKKEPFVGIKLAGLNHYFWFKKEDIKSTYPVFKAEFGWGKDREQTSLECLSSEIVSVIYSNNLQ